MHKQEWPNLQRMSSMKTRLINYNLCSYVIIVKRGQHVLEFQQQADNLPVGVHIRPYFLIQDVSIVCSLKYKFYDNANIPF